MKLHHYLLPVLLLSMLNYSCKKEDNGAITPVYSVPATYNFDNVNYTNQKMLLLMADQLVAEINKGNTVPGTVVSAQKLKDMFNNVNSYFTDSSFKLNASGLKLADCCSAAAKTDMMSYFDSIALYSTSGTPASHGVAGTTASAVNTSKKYLLSPGGIFYSQLVKKTIMGIFAYQIANVYLTDSINNSVDNKTVVTGYGTAMEHHWDEAFGFFGVPVDFPATKTGTKYFGAYSNQVDAGMGSNATIMNAFLKGRAAVSNKDMTTKDAQAKLLRTTFERLDAGCIVQEMKETEANIDAGDAVAAYSTLSETLGFIRSLKYNTSPERIITNAQIAQLEALLDAGNPANPDFYKFMTGTVPELKARTNAIRNFIGTVYGFTAEQLIAL